MMKPEVGMSRFNMCERISKSINDTFENFVPRKSFELYLVWGNNEL